MGQEASKLVESDPQMDQKLLKNDPRAPQDGPKLIKIVQNDIQMLPKANCHAYANIDRRFS